MLRFKNVMVGKNSELGDALAKGDRKQAEKVYAETTERYKRQYPEEDRKWFDRFMPI